MRKKVKLPRKQKKKFIKLRNMGRLKYWIQQQAIINGSRARFDKVVRGIPSNIYKYIPSVGLRRRTKEELEANRCSAYEYLIP